MFIISIRRDKRREFFHEMSKKKKNLSRKGEREKEGKIIHYDKNTHMFVGRREHKYNHHCVIRCPPKYKGSYYNDADSQ